MATSWNPTDMKRGGEAYYLTRLGMLVISAVREYSLPTGTMVFQISIPTMWALADGMYDGAYNEETAIKPSEQPQFIDSLGDV